VVLELSAAIRAVGFKADVIGPEELGMSGPPNLRWGQTYARRLAEFVRKSGDGYDVYDYDHVYPPFPRSEFSANALMVARSVLLMHHIQRIVPPTPRTARAWIGAALRSPRRRRELQTYVDMADRCIAQADLVNVSNDQDKTELTRRGVPPDKIVVLPFGISQQRRCQLERQCLESPPPDAIVAFVGTFDYRKGAADFPRLVRGVLDQVPQARFRLLGTRAMFQTARQVLAHFPRDARRHVEVVPHYPADELPRLLADCAVGVFPSYYEGFPFGVLEMLAAAIPVIAYDAPGPPMMLPADYLVRPGDVAAMSRKTAELLKDRQKLLEARRRARQLSRPFDWGDIAHRTAQIYGDALATRRQGVR